MKPFVLIISLIQEFQIMEGKDNPNSVHPVLWGWLEK